ncbi:MAG: DUF3828 domain-containing protein [Gammaproteobacteria bacterium]|nr:DUF3828 domain-containing protein [Gammaproteobacteria bacterium]
MIQLYTTSLIIICLAVVTPALADISTDESFESTSNVVNATSPANIPKVPKKKKLAQKLQKLVEGFYQGDKLEAFWTSEPDMYSTLLSKHLIELFENNRKQHDDLFLGFDPFVNGQDALIKDLVVYPVQVNGLNATVRASFKNFDHEITLIYSFVWEGSVWKLDEMVSISGGYRWLLSDVLINP